MTNLLTLATQIEQATEDQQREMLWHAFRLLDHEASDARYDLFRAMLDAKAYESAAMMLVPEGYCISAMGEVPDDLCFYVDLWGENESEGEPECRAKTLALALAAACCRAVAQMGEG